MATVRFLSRTAALGILLLGLVMPAAAATVSAAPSAADRAQSQPAAEASIDSLSPDAGPLIGGTVVTIKGEGLDRAASVQFGPRTGFDLVRVSPTKLKVTSPEGSAPGPVKVRVTLRGGDTTNRLDFTYRPAPEITGVSPTSGPDAGGTRVVISGQHLKDATAVMFGSTPAADFAFSFGSLVAITRPSEAGVVSVSVTTSGGTTTQPEAFSFESTRRGPWSTAAGGSFHTCGVRNLGELWCWGLGSSGQLGTGDGFDRRWPARVGTGTDWQQVTGGKRHTCALQEDASLWCWGENYRGQLGLGSTQVEYTPHQVQPGTTWRQVEAGADHTCAVKIGQLWCWGDNQRGQLGIGKDGGDEVPPTRVGTGVGWTAVSAGGDQTCALRGTGQLFCWGLNDWGQLGLGDVKVRTQPQRVGNAADWTDVSVGTGSVCGLRSGGQLWCWGRNTDQQLGLGGSGGQLETKPVRVSTGTDWSQVAVGSGYACGRRAEGQLWCWGYSGYGALGLGYTNSAPTPTRVGTATWDLVFSGGAHTGGLAPDQTLWMWGYNEYGRLGLGGGTQQYRLFPTVLP